MTKFLIILFSMLAFLGSLPPAEKLKSSSWRFLKIEPPDGASRPPVPGACEITLSFSDSTYSGNFGCNHHAGRCRISGERIFLLDADVTLMHCECAELERYLEEKLSEVYYSINDDTLKLKTKDGTVLIYIAGK